MEAIIVCFRTNWQTIIINFICSIFERLNMQTVCKLSWWELVPTGGWIGLHSQWTSWSFSATSLWLNDYKVIQCDSNFELVRYGWKKYCRNIVDISKNIINFLYKSYINIYQNNSLNFCMEWCNKCTFLDDSEITT